MTRSLGTNNLVINVLVLVVVVVVVVFRFVPFRRKCCWLANVFNFFLLRNLLMDRFQPLQTTSNFSYFYRLANRSSCFVCLIKLWSSLITRLLCPCKICIKRFYLIFFNQRGFVKFNNRKSLALKKKNFRVQFLNNRDLKDRGFMIVSTKISCLRTRLLINYRILFHLNVIMKTISQLNMAAGSNHPRILCPRYG